MKGILVWKTILRTNWTILLINEKALVNEQLQIVKVSHNEQLFPSYKVAKKIYYILIILTTDI
jgi:hypothetical protein